MKKSISMLLAAMMLTGTLSGCGGSSSSAPAGSAAASGSASGSAAASAPAETVVLKVAASPTPHAEILEVAKEILAEKDITLDIQTYNDYVVPNTVVEDGTVDANYFQHTPYLDDFNKENGTHIVSVAAIHVEPMGLYGGKQTTLDALK